MPPRDAALRPITAAEAKLASAMGKTIAAHANPKTAAVNARFFKCGPGEYGAGAKFLGLTNPTVRSLAKSFIAAHDIVASKEGREMKDSKKKMKKQQQQEDAGTGITIPFANKMADSPYNEQRFFALLLLIHLFARKAATAADRRDVYACYMRWASNELYVNNWNLVDLSAPDIVGQYYLTDATSPKERELLLAMTHSPNLWVRRIAVVAMLAFVRQQALDLPIRVCAAVLHDPHDLMHKACGWVLREIGKKQAPVLHTFLTQHAAAMPRTTLRYAVERLAVEERQRYMGMAAIAAVPGGPGASSRKRQRE